MDRVFLDANVLFSAAYRADEGLAKLWKLSGVQLITSNYAVAEAQLNLDTDTQRQRLEGLVKRLEVVGEQPNEPDLLRDVNLHEKDRPILLAAVRSNATHLITGDLRHFGKYLEQSISGVFIQTPAAYLRRHAR